MTPFHAPKPAAMRRTPRPSTCTAIAIAAAALVAAPIALPAQPLSPADLLAIRTATPGDFTPDGSAFLLRVSRRGDGLGFVAARDGDPSYTRPAPARLLLVNAATGDTTAILPTPRTIGATAWSRDGKRLAIATRDSVPALLIWDATTRRLRPQPLPGLRLAENTTLAWTTDGRLVFSVRERGWLAEVQARFDSLVKGPITVQVGTEPFLAWDVLRRLGNRALVVALTPATGRLDTLVGPTQLQSWTVATSGTAITWREDRNTKTNYEGGATNESRMMVRRLAAAGAASAGARPAGTPAASGTSAAPAADSARPLFASLRGITVSMADDGERYAFGRDGAVYVASLADTTPRRLIGPAPRPAGQGGGANRPPGAEAGTPAADSAARRDTTERFTLVRMSPTGDAVVVSSRTGLHLVATADGARRPLAAITDTLRGPRVALVDWSADGTTLLLTRASRTAWDRALVRITAATGQADTLARDGRLYGAPQLSPTGSHLALTIGAEGRPADPYVADLGVTPSLAGARRIVEANPQLAGRALPRTQLVRYLDVDGRTQYGVLTLPADAGTRPVQPLPTVFSIYEEFFDDGFDATTTYLASHGYAVMKPSVTFEIGYPGEAWLKGVTAAANKLVELGIADSTRLGVHGTSYGGYATNLLITQTHRFKAAINISGKVDIISFYTDSPRLGVRNANAAERTQDRIGATLWEQPQKYVAHSAVMFADRIRTPLLLLTGGEDHNVPAINTREMYFALRRLGKPVEWVNYVNGGHGIPMTTAAEFGDWHARLLGWYDRYLKPGKAGTAATSQDRL
jgi:dipeptidyl aminopeptidase/acylaminoacyl peptidase